VQSRLEMGNEVLARRRWSFECHEGADVHVRRVLFLVQEGRVDCGKTVLVPLRGHDPQTIREQSGL
jgi:hypothetical protein